MKLRHLSIVSIAGCIIGLLVLVLIALLSYQGMRAKQAGIAELLALEKRIDSFSVASDSMLLFGPDPSMWRSHREEAQELQRRLQALGSEYPHARNAARHIGQLVDSLDRVLGGAVPAAGGSPHFRDGDPTAETGPLGVPPRSRIILNQIASHGIALDTAFDEALSARQRDIAREATRIAAAFAGGAGLFGVLCVAAFGLIHRRISGPTRALAGVIDRVRAGDLDARARVTGSDELAELAHELNRLVEHRQSVDRRLAEQQEALQRREAMLADSQRMAHIGSWRLDLSDETLKWSDETYRIVGASPGSFTPTAPAFFQFVHPDDRDRVAAVNQSIREGRSEHDIEFRIIRPDGAVRHVREHGEDLHDPAGVGRLRVGTVQDITEQKQREERLHQYRELIEASDDAFSISDADYRYVLVNKAYADWFGLDRSQIEGRPVAEVMGEIYFNGEIKPALERTLAGEIQNFETRRDYPGRGTRDLLLRYYPIDSLEGPATQVGAVITDITEIKQAETELARQRNLLEIAGRTARLGGWSRDLISDEANWSDVVAELHDMPHGYSPPTLEEAIGFYAPQWRETLRELFTACAEHGDPYDIELELITARGERRWVRAVGEPVRDEAGNVVRIQGAFQDISARKTAELERSKEADRTRAILESITDAFYTLDDQWRFGYINNAAAVLLERAGEQLVGKNVWEEFPEAVGSRIESEYRRAVAEQVTVALEEYYPPLEKWFDIRAYPTDDGLAVYFRDSTERNEMLARLREQEQKLRKSRDDLAQVLDTRQALINSLPAHIALLDGDGEVIDVNEQWRHFATDNNIRDPRLGIGANYIAICESATGDCAEGAQEAADGIRAVLAGERDTFTLEYPCHSPNEYRWFRMMANRLSMGEVAHHFYGAVVMHVDITERKLAEQELNRLAFQDPLTGLPSRNGFVQLVSEWLGRAAMPVDGFVVSLNVRGLHDINEAHGFAAGDELLRQVGTRLCVSAGDDAVVARAGGDDFVVFLPEAPGKPPRQAEEVAAAFAEPFDLGNVRMEASARFGFTRVNSRRGPVEEMLRESSLALSHTRHDHVGLSSTAYSRILDDQAQERVRTNQELRQALQSGEFELHFQPQVELASGRLVSCEALLRWRHPVRGLVPPGGFIPHAEQSQLIVPIGEWVVDEACRCLREWRDAGLQVVRVSVNVSLMQFMVGDFTKTVREALAKHGVAPSSLSLEITESIFERHSEELLAQMKVLHEMGVYLSLDDFGTGYSSLLYLQRYPFNEVKIDRDFVQEVLEDSYSRHVVTTVLGLAHALGADVVAEGIETNAVQDKLLELGCRLGQGFYYSVPLEAEDFRWLLEQGPELPLQASGGALNRDQRG